jgi:hypothetical protein
VRSRIDKNSAASLHPINRLLPPIATCPPVVADYTRVLRWYGYVAVWQ